jgi:hypothetical protein
MAIPLVEADEVRTGRGGGKTKGEKYGKYAVAVEKQVQWIKDAIGQSKDGSIRVKAVDLAKEMGGDFAKKNPTSIYWGLKYVLFNEGIVVDTGTHKSGDKLLVMRLGTEEDKLPPSLSKYLEPEDEGDEGASEGTEE